MDEEIYKQLKEKCLEISEIFLTEFNKASSKEEIEKLTHPPFGTSFEKFVIFTIALEDNGNISESVKKAANLYLKDIDKSISRATKGNYTVTE